MQTITGYELRDGHTHSVLRTYPGMQPGTTAWKRAERAAERRNQTYGSHRYYLVPVYQTADATQGA